MSNKFKFILPKTDQYIDLPIELKWDFYGRDDSINVYEADVLKELVGSAEDFEILRFAHAPYSSDTKTDIKYNFHFFSVFKDFYKVLVYVNVLNSYHNFYIRL